MGGLSEHVFVQSGKKKVMEEKSVPSARNNDCVLFELEFDGEREKERGTG